MKQNEEPLSGTLEELKVRFPGIHVFRKGTEYEKFVERINKFNDTITREDGEVTYTDLGIITVKLDDLDIQCHALNVEGGFGVSGLQYRGQLWQDKVSKNWIYRGAGVDDNNPKVKELTSEAQSHGLNCYCCQKPIPSRKMYYAFEALKDRDGFKNEPDGYCKGGMCVVLTGLKDKKGSLKPYPGRFLILLSFSLWQTLFSLWFSWRLFSLCR